MSCCLSAGDWRYTPDDRKNDMTQPTPLSVPSSAARRRTWAEKPPRVWLLVAALFLCSALLMAATRVSAVMRERRVIAEGTPVSAKVIQIGVSAQHQANRDEQLFVYLGYSPPGATKEITATGLLQRKPGEVLKAKSMIDVKIDPTDPAYFTDRTQPPPLSAEIGMPLLLVATSGLCMLIAWRKRASVLRVLREGVSRTATISSVKQTPLAPLSKQLAVSIDGSDDRRLVHLYWPNRAGPVSRGQSIEVIVREANHHVPLAAAMYVGTRQQ